MFRTFQMPEALPFTTEHGLLAGYGCGERGPYLVLDELDGVPWERQVVSVRERTFTLTQGPMRYCTGRHDLGSGESIPCPLRSAPSDPNLEQCYACFSATGFNPAFYNAQQVSPQQRLRNRQPHAVYLVSFGKGTLKVGMTLAARRLSRLLEQGARLGAVLATFPDADAARELEESITRGYDVAESVRAARKRHLLGAPFSLSDARRELADEIERVAADHPEVDRHAPILELDEYYFDDGALDGTLTDLSATEPLAISGRCRGMIGDVLLMAQGGQRYMLSIGSMVAHRVRIEGAERENHFVGQLGLPF